MTDMDRNDPGQNQLRSHSMRWILLMLLVAGTCVAGLFFPSTWWATHFLFFLPPFLRYSILGAAAVLAIFAVLPLSKNNPVGPVEVRRWVVFPWAVGFGLLLWLFPLELDFYGSAASYLDEMVTAIPEGTARAIFAPDVSAAGGQRTAAAIVAYIAFFAGTTLREAFHYLDVFCGFLYALLWLGFIQHYIAHRLWRGMLVLAALCTPAALVFFGHSGVNALVLLLCSLWAVTLLHYFDKRNALWLWTLLLLALLCIKMHPATLIFLPVWVMVAVYHFLGQISFTSRWFNWRGALLWVFVPVLLAVISLHFFGFGKTWFLPVTVKGDPLHHYTLFGADHLFDYFNELLLWSPVALFVLLVMAFTPAKARWNTPAAVLSGTTLLLLAGLLFLLDPTHGLPLDWGLFCMPMPFLLAFCAACLRQVPPADRPVAVMAPGLSLALLVLPAFLVHANNEWLSQRMEAVGEYIYFTRYDGAGRTVERALDLSGAGSEAIAARRASLIHTWRAEALPGNDPEYAHLLINQGKYYLRVAGDPATAHAYFNQAADYDNSNKDLVLLQMEAYFFSGNFREAYSRSLDLIALDYPSGPRAHKIAIQCALEAALYGQAFLLCEQYIARFGQDELIKTVYERLAKKEDVENLKSLFKSGE